MATTREMSRSVRERMRTSWAVDVTRSEYHVAACASRRQFDGDSCLYLVVGSDRLRPTQGRAGREHGRSSTLRQEATVRPILTRVFFAATILILALPSLGYADGPASWLVPGGGLAWPPDEFQGDDPSAAFGGIFGARIAETWGLEARGHYTSLKSLFSGVPNMKL